MMKTMKKIAAMLTMAAMLGACGPFVDNPLADQTVTVTDVQIDGLSGGVGALTVGSTLQLTATISPANATDAGVTYSSTNDEVATVTIDGLVTAVGPGTVTITVISTSNPSVTQSVTLTVADDLLEVSDAIDQAEAEARTKR